MYPLLIYKKDKAIYKKDKAKLKKNKIKFNILDNFTLRIKNVQFDLGSSLFGLYKKTEFKYSIFMSFSNNLIII